MEVGKRVTSYGQGCPSPSRAESDTYSWYDVEPFKTITLIYTVHIVINVLYEMEKATRVRQKIVMEYVAQCSINTEQLKRHPFSDTHVVLGRPCLLFAILLVFDFNIPF